ncbi:MULTISPECIES: MFS transporter [Thermocrispum]|jgi:MFS family permease|uniref:MFS transporter n=1 Tax=Thermocrispum agreste TaxID=37925 RepID=A0A2W4L9Z2_9PSEU|nr:MULTISPECIES: MFS transporter [Thermocrispum]PZM97829.1 MAG: MFS transporter [Thermocrispum agreste]
MRRVIGSGSDDRKGPSVFGGRSRRGRNKPARKWVPDPEPTRRSRGAVTPPPTKRFAEPPAARPPVEDPPHRITADQAYTVELEREQRRQPREQAEPGAPGWERYGTDGYLRPPGHRSRGYERQAPPPGERPYDERRQRFYDGPAGRPYPERGGYRGRDEHGYPHPGGYDQRGRAHYEGPGHEPPGHAGGHGGQPPGGGHVPPGGGQVPPGDGPVGPDGRPWPKKLTVTRVAAMRGRELSERAVRLFQRVHRADGAHESGLTSLSWSLMLNYASDAALAVALANTLFFSAATAESKWKVALYLLITIAPFAVIAPLIGPALDKIQRGRRLAMAVASAASAVMCMVIALNFDNWALYPAALGKMVLSKSYMVLKSAVTPRVVPPEITLSKTNARLTVFGLGAGAVGGAIASLFSWIAGSPGAAWVAAAICVAGTVQAMRIPSWVEVTEGEVPATLNSQAIRRKPAGKQPITVGVLVALWGNGTIRLLTGFLMLFAAFAVKASAEQHDQSPFVQLLLLGVLGAAAGAGGFVGNAIGSRLHLGGTDQVTTVAVATTLAATVLAALLPGIATAALVALIGATCSALAKISLDAVIQHDLPEESRASAFGRSETVLQMAWCFGGAIGLLLPPTYWLGFLVISVLLVLGLVQTILVRRGKSLLPSREIFSRRRAAAATSGTPAGSAPSSGSAEPAGAAPATGGPSGSDGTKRRPRTTKWTPQ